MRLQLSRWQVRNAYVENLLIPTYFYQLIKLLFFVFPLVFAERSLASVVKFFQLSVSYVFNFLDAVRYSSYFNTISYALFFQFLFSDL